MEDEQMIRFQVNKYTQIWACMKSKEDAITALGSLYKLSTRFNNNNV